jgi:hypothetical protein
MGYKWLKMKIGNWEEIALRTCFSIFQAFFGISGHPGFWLLALVLVVLGWLDGVPGAWRLRLASGFNGISKASAMNLRPSRFSGSFAEP